MPPPSKSALERHPGTIHMFIGQFFKQNPNFGVKRLTKAISRVQVNNENGNPRDQDRELLIFSNMHMIHVYMPIF